MKRKLLAFVALVGVLQLSGCASLGVQPWERDLLAKDEMALGAEGVRQGVKEGEATKVCDERCVERNNMSALLVVLQPLTAVRHPRLPTRVAPTRCARCASKSAPPPPPPPLPPTPPTRRLPRLPQTRHAISGTCCTQRRTGRGAHH